MAASRSGDSDQRSSFPQSASKSTHSPAASRQHRRRAERLSRQPSALSDSQETRELGEAQPSEPTDAPRSASRTFRPQQPRWLTLMQWTQRGSSLVALMLGASILITYGWTVYIQQQWGREFDRLEAMKKQERQLVSANEVLKNQMAEQAERPTAGLLLPDPSNAIFLTPAPQRPDVKASSTPPVEPDSTRPLGY